MLPFSFQQTNRTPWGAAIDPLMQALSGAMNAYNSTYNGPLVAGMDPNVTQGQNEILANADKGMVSGGAGDALARLRAMLANGGLSAEHMQGADAMRSGMGILGGVAGNLNPYARGDFLAQGNPYLEKVIQNSMSDASNGVNSQFTAAGRYGSGAHSGALGDRLGRIATDARFNDYYQQQQNQLAANQSLMGVASGMGGLGSGLAGIGQMGFGNLAAGGGALESLGNAQNFDARQRMGVGAQRMDYQQALIDAQNQAPWMRAGNLANIASQIGGLGGTSTTFGFGNQDPQQKQGGSTLNNVLGGILGGVGMFKNLFSDERLKENVKKVGKLDNGQNVYVYNYKGGGPKMLGLLAQEVAKVRPQAVARHDSGYLTVNYGEAAA